MLPEKKSDKNIGLVSEKFFFFDSDGLAFARTLKPIDHRRSGDDLDPNQRNDRDAPI